MLKEHNREVYEATKNMLLEHRECCLVAATGIGKSNITTELIQELGLNALIIAPKTSIRDEWSIMPDKYGIPPTFSTMTYQYFVRHYENLYGFDAYIFDEAHHTGAPKWGKAIRKFREGLDTEFVLGLTADPNRYNDKSKRDKENKIISSVVRSVFNDHGVYGHDQGSAIENGILPRATYVCSIYNADEMFDMYEAMDLTEELRGQLNYTRTNCEAIEDTLRRNVPKDVPVKGIVFVDTINNIDIGVRLARRAFPREAVHYIHSNLSAKENAETLEMFKKAKSGFIVSIDMIGEGLHIDGINTVIMLRKTGSPSVYTQQIGRGLAAGSKDATIFDFVRNDTSIKKVLARIKNMTESYQNDKNEEDDSEKDTTDNSIGRTRYPKISDQFIVKDKASDILEVFDEIDKYISQKDKKNKKWTENDDKILRDNYPEMGGKVCDLLEGKTDIDCRLRASKLKIKYNKTPEKWTEREEQILRDNYPTMGGKVYEMLEGRDRGQCNRRAQLLGIKFDDVWTEKDEEIMKKYYPSMGTDIVEMLSRSKSRSSIQHKAIRMGLKKDSKEWSEYEDDILRKYYPSIGGKVSEKINRTVSAIRSRAAILGIECECNNIWSADEDNIIRTYYPSMGGKVCELLNGRTNKACCARAKLLMVKRNFNEWTEEEDKILMEKYPIIGTKAFKLLNNRTFRACKRRLSILGIRRNAGGTNND